MDSEGQVGISMVEAGCEDGGRDDGEEGDGSDDSMGGYEGMVFWKAAKPVAHTCRAILDDWLLDLALKYGPLNRVAVKGSPWMFGSKKSSRP